MASFLNKTNKKGRTALMEAAKNGDRATIGVLLDRGSDIRIADAKKRTVLHAAAGARYCSTHVNLTNAMVGTTMTISYILE